MYVDTFSLTPWLDGSGWSRPRPGRFTPGKETQYQGCAVGTQNLQLLDFSNFHSDSFIKSQYVLITVNL
jgi:hypothetical protein